MNTGDGIAEPQNKEFQNFLFLFSPLCVVSEIHHTSVFCRQQQTYFFGSFFCSFAYMYVKRTSCETKKFSIALNEISCIVEFLPKKLNFQKWRIWPKAKKINIHDVPTEIFARYFVNFSQIFFFVRDSICGEFYSGKKKSSFRTCIYTIFYRSQVVNLIIDCWQLKYFIFSRS